MNETIISWTDATWNPVHGCSRISDGCRNCYAERISVQKGLTKFPWTAVNASRNVQLKPHKLREPYKLKIPSRIFVNSMSDLFHELIPDDYIARIFRVMTELPQHTFQILTKRAERAAEWPGPWSENIWMGVSVESAREAHRVTTLRACGAKTKFVSYEPALASLGDVNLSGYSWLIVGGESGPGYRKMDMAWAREARDLCRRYGLAFFFKQDSGAVTEQRPWLIEENGMKREYKEYPASARPLQSEIPLIFR